MEFINANDELSQWTATQNSAIVKLKRCYNNVADIALAGTLPVADKSELTVAFGGAQIFEDAEVYSRHAFFIVNGQAVDPTLALKNRTANKKYFVVESYNYEDYISLITDGMNATPETIRQAFVRASQVLLSKGIYLIGD